MHADTYPHMWITFVALWITFQERETMMETIYVLLDPRDHYTAYIGRTMQPRRRFTYHLSHSCANPVMAAWLKELKELKQRPLMREIEAVSRGMAGQREQYWINDYERRGFRVLNRQAQRGWKGSYPHAVHKL